MFTSVVCIPGGSDSGREKRKSFLINLTERAVWLQNRVLDCQVPQPCSTCSSPHLSVFNPHSPFCALPPAMEKQGKCLPKERQKSLIETWSFLFARYNFCLLAVCGEASSVFQNLSYKSHLFVTFRELQLKHSSLGKFTFGVCKLASSWPRKSSYNDLGLLATE